MRLGYAWLAGISLVLVLGVVGREGTAKDSPAGEIVRGELGATLNEAVLQAAPEFWGSVLVAKAGEIVLAKGYGDADYASVPNTPSTLHGLGSASKQIVGVAILHLQERGKLKVTDAIGRFFEDVPDEKQAITVHQLLTHTSGISGTTRIPEDSALHRVDYVDRVLGEELAAKPGERYEYCNVGYGLLAAIIEEVAERTYEEYVEEYLFGPARMEDSGFVGDKDLRRSGRASTRKGVTPPRTAADWSRGWGNRGMGGVVTTVRDLFLWDRALRNGKLLTKEGLKALYKPAKNGYAYGWSVALTDSGSTKALCSGRGQGYECWTVRFLDEDLCWFILSNRTQPTSRVSHAVEAVLTKSVDLQVRIDGRRHLEDGDTIVVPKKLTWASRRRRDTLRLELKGWPTVILAVDIPVSTAGKRLLHEVRQAISSREADPQGGVARFGGRIYVGDDVRSLPKLFSFGLVEIKAELHYADEDGIERYERRVTLALADSKSEHPRGWVFMNVAAARKLESALSRHVK